MSSYAASCCTCFPKASSASVTSISLPTASGLTSCHSASQHSAPSHHQPYLKPPPMSHLTIFRSALTVCPHGDHRDGCPPDPTPFPTALGHGCRMKSLFPFAKTLRAAPRYASLRLAAEPILTLPFTLRHPPEHRSIALPNPPSARLDSCSPVRSTCIRPPGPIQFP